MIDHGFDKEKLQEWDLEEIDKVNSIIEMRADYATAHDAYQMKEAEERSKRRK